MFSINMFLKELNELYPEKVVSLLGINYSPEMLHSFLINKLLTKHTFEPNEFKKYLNALRSAI